MGRRQHRVVGGGGGCCVRNRNAVVAACEIEMLVSKMLDNRAFTVLCYGLCDKFFVTPQRAGLYAFTMIKRIAEFQSVTSGQTCLSQWLCTGVSES